jgi:uncharacterized protein (DUF305 family)
MKPATLALALSMAAAAPALWAAQPDNEQMHQDYMASMSRMADTMHKGIMANDPDVAFAAGMLPHHQGAVEMAQIELKYGKDPVMRRLAENVIKSQSAEIKLMKTWLAKHPDSR